MLDMLMWFPVDIGGFVIGLGQISFFFSLRPIVVKSGLSRKKLPLSSYAGYSEARSDAQYNERC